MEPLPFTLATYRLKPGKERDFIERWRELARVFSRVENPPFWGTLLQSRSDRGLFYSFGPWEKPEHVAAMRSDAGAAAAFAAVRELCDELTPGD